MTDILMSAENPDGWTLEDLLRQMRDEIRRKNDRIRGQALEASTAGALPASVAAGKVYANNLRIMACLREALERQEDSIAALDALAPNPGPRGAPRIGAGPLPPMQEQEERFLAHMAKKAATPGMRGLAAE